MKILVTGNRGYIGSVLTQILTNENHQVIGYDTGYYDNCKLDNIPEPNKQIKKDIRNTTKIALNSVETVIHLAALSNDTLGELNFKLTEDINFKATINLARLAKKARVRRFIYASSQSMYGISDIDEELEEEKSIKNPLTAYAKTKWQAECELKKLDSDDFTVVCFRLSTVFGASPSLRCDIVFNNLVACAYTTGKIEIKSDGTPWRPVVHVRDVCAAFIAGLEAPSKLIANQSYNVGIPSGNYTVRQLAEAAQKAVPGSILTFTGDHGSDTRTYRVSFKKILTELSDYYQPKWNLERGGQELVKFFKQINFTEEMFRGRFCNRLAQLKHLINIQKIDSNLFWTKS